MLHPAETPLPDAKIVEPVPHARRRLGNRQRRLGLHVEPRAVEASRAAHAHHGRHDSGARREPEPARQILLRRLDLSQRNDQLQTPARVPPGRRHHHRRRSEPRLADGHAARVLLEDGLRPREVQTGVLSVHRAERRRGRVTWNRAANGSRWAAPASSAPKSRCRSAANTRCSPGASASNASPCSASASRISASFIGTNLDELEEGAAMPIVNIDLAWLNQLLGKPSDRDAAGIARADRLRRGRRGRDRAQPLPAMRLAGRASARAGRSEGLHHLQLRIAKRRSKRPAASK